MCFSPQLKKKEFLGSRLEPPSGDPRGCGEAIHSFRDSCCNVQDLMARRRNSEQRTVCSLARSPAVAPGTHRIRSTSHCRVFRALHDPTSSLKVCLRRERPSRETGWLPYLSHMVSKNRGMKWTSFLHVSFLKINSYLVEADRHWLKIKASEKAAPLLSAPHLQHPPPLSWRALVVFNKGERATLKFPVFYPRCEAERE